MTSAGRYSLNKSINKRSLNTKSLFTTKKGPFTAFLVAKARLAALPIVAKRNVDSTKLPY